MKNGFMRRKACFACTTPYQVLGAISLTLDSKLDADLYIFGMFPKYDEISNRLEKYKIFANVYAVNCYKLGSPGRTKGFIQMAFPENTVSFYLPKYISYDFYYSSSRALSKTILQHVLLKRNPSMQRVIYEDGLGTYLGNGHVLKATKLKRIAERILQWDLDKPDNTIIMAHIPELVDIPEQFKGCKVEKMPYIELNKATMTMLEDVFLVDENSQINNRVIIFDTLRTKQAENNQNPLKDLDDCYQAIVEIVDKEDVICKPHPRSTANTSIGVNMYNKQHIPMEILYATMEDIENRILICFNSSAAFTPKILFNKEPVIICLHKIQKYLPQGFAPFDSIFEKFSQLYTDKNRVYAPASLDELNSILCKLLC